MTTAIAMEVAKLVFKSDPKPEIYFTNNRKWISMYGVERLTGESIKLIVNAEEAAYKALVEVLLQESYEHDSTGNRVVR